MKVSSSSEEDLKFPEKSENLNSIFIEQIVLFIFIASKSKCLSSNKVTRLKHCLVPIE